MKSRIIHPLWTHLAALAALIYLVIRVIIDGPLPARAAVHFNWQGQADSYGSPWLGLGLSIGLSVFFIVLSAFLDELWTRQEKAKTFNWLSLFDEIVVGSLVGLSLGNLAFITSGAEQFIFPWAYLGGALGITALLGVIFEWLRPFRLAGQPTVSGQDIPALEKEYASKARENKAFVYWESQNPLYITLLTVVLPLIMIAVAVITWFSQPWAALVVLIAALLLIIPYGGLRTVVTAQEITVSFGLPGIKVLRIKVRDIAGLELKEFAPLRDFGGYGIRFNGQMTAYYMRGNRGVALTMPGGKRYLLGSDNPERLLSVIRAIRGT